MDGLQNGINGEAAPFEIICGPLLNYKHLSNPDTAPIWNGSVLIVTRPGQINPRLELNRKHSSFGARRFEGSKLYEDPDKAFWQFAIDLPLSQEETEWEYKILNTRAIPGASGKASRTSHSFFVPATGTSMRFMFHSCNGFSVGTDEEAWSGPALWNDVLRAHEAHPLHVMIGGGDQIYNDGVRVHGPLKVWTDIANPLKRRDFPFDDQLRMDCDEFYYQNYIRWYSTEPFATANAQIPQINIWDDHDIIDGFGSYTDHFMRCAVFRGIGGVAFKYYSLFQHHVAPPSRTFTTDPINPEKPQNTFTAPAKLDSSFIQGSKPGPYVEEHSLSVFSRLGAGVAFLGIDARMERTRHQINYPETYNKIFERLDYEVNASPGQIRHLILLLGVPIAYPRLIWLENILTSPLISPIRFLNKRFGLAGGLFNHFDGQVDILDDLDDHYTARQHKKERKDLILRLQRFAKAHSIRVTILGGDVHLAAMGRFYTPTKHNIATENDHRYMANIISSAITNKPPPAIIANMLSRRNRVHKLDHETHETLMPLFDKSPGNVPKAASYNHVTMPSRNFAIITPSNLTSPNGNVNGGTRGFSNGTSSRPMPKDGHSPLHLGEESAGTKHVAASAIQSGIFPGGLDVCYHIEIDQHDRSGRTETYGFSSESPIFLLS
jgi:hypothetical protein